MCGTAHRRRRCAFRRAKGWLLRQVTQGRTESHPHGRGFRSAAEIVESFTSDSAALGICRIFQVTIPAPTGRGRRPSNKILRSTTRRSIPEPSTRNGCSSWRSGFGRPRISTSTIRPSASTPANKKHRFETHHQWSVPRMEKLELRCGGFETRNTHVNATYPYHRSRRFHRITSRNDCLRKAARSSAPTASRLL